MSLTLANWVLVIIIGFIGIVGGIAAGIHFFDEDRKVIGIIVGFLISVACIVGPIIFFQWRNTSTASGIRSYKDWQSELDNGLNREIIITAEDGREIFRYEGRVDIESNHEDNYIKFESEDGKRYMIYYGIQDTIQIIEKDE